MPPKQIISTKPIPAGPTKSQPKPTTIQYAHPLESGPTRGTGAAAPPALKLAKPAEESKDGKKPAAAPVNKTAPKKAPMSKL